MFVYFFIQDSIIDEIVTKEGIPDYPFHPLSPFFIIPFFLMFAIPVMFGIIINNKFPTHKYKWLFVISVVISCFIILFFIGFFIILYISDNFT